MTDHICATLAICLALSATIPNEQSGRKREAATTITVSVTAFCIAGKTRSGTEVKEGVAAADPRVFPLGSRVAVDGLTGGHDGTYTVSDTGRGIKGRELDIFIADCDAAKRFGRQQARVRVLQHSGRSKPIS